MNTTNKRPDVEDYFDDWKQRETLVQEMRLNFYVMRHNFLTYRQQLELLKVDTLVKVK